jgi:hypothetical protein
MLTSAVAALTFVFSAALASGADLTGSPVTFTSEGAPVQALLYRTAGGVKQPALVLSPDINRIEWL